MSKSKGIARLVAVCSREQVTSFDQHHIPINIDKNLIMKLQVDDSCLTCHSHGINKTSQAYQTFRKSYKKLTTEELQNALCVSISQIKEYIPRCVPCLGCRTSIDHFLKTILQYRHQAFQPILINENDLFILQESHPDSIYSLFYIHGSKFNSFLESIPKSKKNRRCHIHSLDKTKSIQDWQIVWDMMNKECREEITLVESDELLDSLENYLYKNRFCSECKLKVLEAYDLLFDQKRRERKGFCPALYKGLRSCSNDKHIHIQAEKDFIGSLIARAELDMEDSRRERHAKTLDVAQEEILICLGIHLYERFEKISRTIRSEEQTWQLLFYIIVDCLRLNFEMIKEDFNVTLKSLCEEFSGNDQIKASKKAKRMKKKSGRQMKINEEENIRVENPFDDQEEKELNVGDRRDRSSSSSILPGRLLIKSQSYPTLFLSPSEQKIQLSSSLETLFSSISTRDWICDETNSRKQPISCEECPTLSSVSCIRCSSARTDLGYSSELDDASSSGPCDYSSTTCVACLTGCPLHEGESILSNDICCINSPVIGQRKFSGDLDCARTIELCDITRKPKLTVQLSDQYPFFDMDLKQTWDESLPTILEPTSFISDDDLHEFSILHTHLEMKRAQLREIFKLKFQIWQQQPTSRT